MNACSHVLRRLLRGFMGPAFVRTGGSAAVNDSIFHHKIYCGRGANISDRVALHRNNIGELAGSEYAEVITAEQFGGDARGCPQSTGGTEPRLDQSLELENAVAERKHAAIGAVSDFDFDC